ncbi:hypothetical protein JVU11DRAFT_4548 [Chiua virens]|nr:hypothetical protein JVU11DRAFT_4548 [Chiua virens]
MAPETTVPLSLPVSSTGTLAGGILPKSQDSSQHLTCGWTRKHAGSAIPIEVQAQLPKGKCPKTKKHAGATAIEHPSSGGLAQLPQSETVNQAMPGHVTTQAVEDQPEDHHSILEDGDDHSHGDSDAEGSDIMMVPSDSDNKPIGVIAGRIAIKAPTWTTGMGCHTTYLQKDPTVVTQRTSNSQVTSGTGCIMAAESEPPAAMQSQTQVHNSRRRLRQCDAQRLDEQPQWSTGPGQPGPVGVTGVSQATSTGWSIMTQTPGQSPSLSPDCDPEPVGMSAQTLVTTTNQMVQNVVRAAIRLAEKHLLTVNGLPSSVDRAMICQNALVEAAKKYSLLAMAQQIMTDQKYRKDLSSMVSQCISNEHHSIKKKTDAMVPTVYGFTSKINPDGTTTMAPPRMVIKAMVEWLSNDLMFVYPYDPNPQVKKYQANKLFSHPAIIPVLDALFFFGQSCHYLRHQDIFISSLPSRPNEPKVPMVMLALVCAVMYTSISKYETGGEQDIEFSHDMAHDVYQELLNLLQEIKSQNPPGYHTLTARMFNELSKYASVISL